MKTTAHRSSKPAAWLTAGALRDGLLGGSAGWALALTVAYFVAGRLGVALNAASGFAPLVWFPNGVALFALFAGGVGLWPAVSLAAFAVSLSAGRPPTIAMAMAAGATLEALLGVTLLRRLRFQPSLARLNDVLVLALAAAIAPSITSTLGVGVLVVGGILPPAVALETVRAWWVGDALGLVLVMPALFVAWARPWARPSAGALETSGLVAALAVAAALVFGSRAPAEELGPAQQAYLIFPPLIWAALRFRQVGTILALLLLGVSAIGGTMLGGGPFARSDPGDSLLLLQSFLGLTSISTLLLAAAVAERDRSYEETRQALESRDDFLLVAAHELRTPLTALKIKVGLVQRGVTTAGLPEDVRQSVTRAVRLVDRLDHMIDDLLDVTRAVSGRLGLELEDTDLREVVDEVAERLRESAARTGSAISVSGDTTCPGRWDRSRLDQVASNLVANAIKYGAGRPIDLTVSAEPATGTLLVRDQGIGIPVADQERIFERFERASPSRRLGGLGLGLWIVRQVVEAMGGTITVKSEPGRGSEFRVDLPRVRSGNLHQA